MQADAASNDQAPLPRRPTRRAATRFYQARQPLSGRGDSPARSGGLDTHATTKQKGAGNAKSKGKPRGLASIEPATPSPAATPAPFSTAGGRRTSVDTDTNEKNPVFLSDQISEDEPGDIAPHAGDLDHSDADCCGNVNVDSSNRVGATATATANVTASSSSSAHPPAKGSVYLLAPAAAESIVSSRGEDGVEKAVTYTGGAPTTNISANNIASSSAGPENICNQKKDTPSRAMNKGVHIGVAAACTGGNAGTNIQRRRGAAGGVLRPNAAAMTSSVPHESSRNSKTRRARKASDRRVGKKDVALVASKPHESSTDIASADKLATKVQGNVKSSNIDDGFPTKVATNLRENLEPKLLGRGLAMVSPSLTVKDERCPLGGRNGAEVYAADTPPQGPTAKASSTEATTKQSSSSALLPASTPDVDAPLIASTVSTKTTPSTVGNSPEAMQKSAPLEKHNAVDEHNAVGSVPEGKRPHETSIPAAIVSSAHVATTPSSRSELETRRAKVDPLLSPPVIPATAVPCRPSQPFGGEVRPALGADSHKVSPAAFTGSRGGAIAGGPEAEHGNTLRVVDEDQQQPRQNNNRLRKQKSRQKRQQQKREGNTLQEAPSSIAFAAATVDLSSKAPPARGAPQAMGAVGGRGAAAAGRGKSGLSSDDQLVTATVGAEKVVGSVKGLDDAVGKVEVLPMNAQQPPPRPPSPTPPPHQNLKYPQSQPQLHQHEQHQHQDTHQYQHHQHQHHQPQHQLQHQRRDDHHLMGTPRKEALSVQQPSGYSSTPSGTTTPTPTTTAATAANAPSSSFYDPESSKPDGSRRSGGGVDKRQEGLLETVDVSGDIAEWAVDNSRGGEFTAMLETIKGASGALSVDTRVVLKQGSGNGGRPQM